MCSSAASSLVHREKNNAIESGYVNRGIKPRNPSGHQSNYLAPTRCIMHSVSIAVCGVLVAGGRLKVRICW